MRIAEISSPSPDCFSQSPQNHKLLSQTESLIEQCERLSPQSQFPEVLVSDLRLCLTHLTQITPLSNSLKLDLWKFSFRLWNACVDLSNASKCHSHGLAQLRHIAADILFLARDVVGVPSSEIKAASFYYKTGLLWHDLHKFDIAAACYEKATELTSKIDAGSVFDAGERKLLLDLNIARSRTAWEISDRDVAVTLLNRAKNLLFASAEHYKALANQFLAFGKSALSNNEGPGLKESLRLMREALELCEKGLNTTRTRDETLILKDMRSKALRFISAVHLQGEEFESVLKCIKVLREENRDDHPCLPVLAMKAWLGLGRYAEAEKELRGMVICKGIPEGVWVSAVETYFQSAGAAGAETTKGVFLGLLGRCHVSAGTAVRLVHRVLGEAIDEGSRVRWKVVADLVSDERVLALFVGEKPAEERAAMHAVLWNRGAEFFRSKAYEMSAVMFEKSLLYIPRDLESKLVRAKGFRVLSLCHLGLSQLDRAEEYINEAAKLEPNIACAFLKFKICLQKNDHAGAITQMQAMTTCFDFIPDFLSLSAHEAIACRALPVAVASLSNLLNFYSSGKSLPIAEVVVWRTLLTILAQDPGNESEIIKYMKRAHTRMSELGIECFFGSGEIGKREENWFAVNSWNFGTRTGKEKDYDLCAQFLRLASEFYGVLAEGQTDDNYVMVCKSLILTVSAMIASEKQKGSTLLDTQVKEAGQLLDRAEKMLTSIASRTRQAADDHDTADADLHLLYTLNAYDISGRLDDSKSQELVVKRFAASRSCRPEHLLQIGLNASQGPLYNEKAALFSLGECLSAFLSSPSPDYRNVALVLRKLITLTSVHGGNTDDEGALYGTYKRAYRIMVGLKDGEYPPEEGKWLAMTAWNRAAMPVRLGQVDLAKKWMDVGLEIANVVPGMETYRVCMRDFLASFQEKFSVK